MVKFGDKVTIVKNKYYGGKKGIVLGHSSFDIEEIRVVLRNGNLYTINKSEIKKGW